MCIILATTLQCECRATSWYSQIAAAFTDAQGLALLLWEAGATLSPWSDEGAVAREYPMTASQAARMLRVGRADTEDRDARITVFGRTWFDPWGHEYRVMLDLNGDGRVDVGKTTIDRRVAAWSVGPNGEDEQGRGDDIGSWQSYKAILRRQKAGSSAVVRCTVLAAAVLGLVVGMRYWYKRRRQKGAVTAPVM